MSLETFLELLVRMLTHFRGSATKSTVAVMMAAAMTTGCGVATTSLSQPGAASESAPDCDIPSDGQLIVILVSGTTREHQPHLTPSAVKRLMAAAASPNASDGKGGRGSVAVLASADGRAHQVLPLTPRRADCRVEHGLQRTKLIETNIERIDAAVSNIAASTPGLDLLSGLDDAVRGLTPGTLIIVSNGLSTDGGFDIRQIKWHADPNKLVDQLNQRQLLSGLLQGWTVLFTGLGDTVGDDQPALLKPARDQLVAYWMAICRAAGATCAVDEAALPVDPPRGHAAMPLIPVPGITSATGPDGHTTATLSDASWSASDSSDATFFEKDSAHLTPMARECLRDLATHIAGKARISAGETVVIRGYVADPPRSTPRDRQQLSSDRASAAADFLHSELATQGQEVHIDAAGAGTPPGMTSIVNGAFDEATAMQMRKVTITY